MEPEITDIGVILMRNDLERVRDWAKGQIRIGSGAPASWDQYVTLIESADAILHEIAVAGILPDPNAALDRNFGRLH